MLYFLVSEQNYTENQQELHSINMEAGPSRSALGMGSAGLARLGHCGVAATGRGSDGVFSSRLVLEVQVDFLGSFQVHSHL